MMHKEIKTHSGWNEYRSNLSFEVSSVRWRRKKTKDVTQRIFFV